MTPSKKAAIYERIKEKHNLTMQELGVYIDKDLKTVYKHRWHGEYVLNGRRMVRKDVIDARINRGMELCVK